MYTSSKTHTGPSTIIHFSPRSTYRYSSPAHPSEFQPDVLIFNPASREPHYRGGDMVTTLLKRARELRQRQTGAEELLWRHLRRKGMKGLKFRRQHQFGPYICDCYCHEVLLAIECDGGYHNEEAQKLRDQVRDAILNEYGVTVLRFSNEQIYERMQEVLASIAQHIQSAAERGVDPD